MPIHLRLKDSIDDRLTWVIGLVLIIAPVIVVCMLLVASERHRQAEQAEKMARSVLDEFDVLLDHTNGELVQMQQKTATCSPLLRQSMQQAAYRLPGVEAFLLANNRQRIYCSSWGVVDPSVEVARLSTRQGLNISSEHRIPVVDQYGVLVYRWGQGGYGALAVLSSVALRQILERSRLPGDAVILFQQNQPIAVNGSVLLQSLPYTDPLENTQNAGKTIHLDANNYLVRVWSRQREELSVAYRYKPRTAWEVIKAEPEILLALLLLNSGLAISWTILRRHRLERIEHQIKIGLRRGEFEAWFQPVVDMRSGRWVGAEALARWIRNREVVASPAEFIAAAEQTGQIRDLTRIMAWEACVLLERIKPIDGNFSISINTSPNYLDNETLAFARAIAHNFKGLNPGDLRIEMTESALSSGRRMQLKATLESLDQLGCKLGIDDFGTGQAGLDYLSDLPFHFLKLDRRYVQSIGTDSVDFLLLENIIQLARSLRLHIVAEGVETEKQAKWLMAHKIYHAQGYYYAKPLSAKHFLRQGFGDLDSHAQPLPFDLAS